MTRSHKLNDRDHAGLADGSAAAEEHLPRYFAKSGHVDSDPKKVKKEGGGKGNWLVAPTYNLLKSGPSLTCYHTRGRSGDEMQDYGYSFTNARRRSNSSSHVGDFKSKFEAVEADPVFEEELHGSPTEDGESINLEKSESADSNSSTSVDEEEHMKKA